MFSGSAGSNEENEAESLQRCDKCRFNFFLPAAVRPAATSSASETMPWLKWFVPALHHALVKTRANPPPELSAGVERQSRDYLIGVKEGKVCEDLLVPQHFSQLNP